ncbi:tetratricopeptide repeat protein [Caulobacter sp. S45]|uniref:tetratricopeptide repeat protein n=1 Tax=Caulobacter sp. S45 TaxID=1641861 RepID=UPI0015770C47|nr:tetratricopeptide repeat protein [Caulobacter sp. S45]
MPASAAELIVDGLAHHRAHRLEEAATRFQAATDRDPRAAQAWRMLGLISQQQGRFADSLEPTRRALALERSASDLSNLANALTCLGRVEEALAAATEAADLDPALPAAQANLGVALRALGHREAAVDRFRRAAELEPRSAEAHANLGVALTELGHLQAAEAALETALTLAPSWADGWYNLGNARLRQLHLPQAEAAYRRAIALAPGHADAHANLAATHKALGRQDLALAHSADAARLRPGDPQVLQNHALTLAEFGRHADAAPVYEAAIALDPTIASLHTNLGSALQEWARTRNDTGVLPLLDRAILGHLAAIALDPGLLAARSNLGLALLARGRFAEATQAFEDAIARWPQVASLYSNLGQCLCDLKRYPEAEAACLRALELDAGMAEAWSTLGNVLVGRREHTQAEIAYRRAVELRPDMAGGWCNLGVALFRENRAAEAEAAYEQALALDPNLADAHWNQALVRLQRGDYAKGFDQYEWRLKRPGRLRDEAQFRQPLWDGSDLGGAAILVHAEQGFGDALQCVRFLPQVAARGGRVVLQARAPLKRLLERASGVDTFVTDGEAPPEVACRLPLFSLPRLFARDLAALPGQSPYLSADPELAAVWRMRMEGLSRAVPQGLADTAPSGEDGRRAWRASPLRVGIVWSGNVSSEVEQGRSIPLIAFSPLARPGVRLVSLQKGDGLEQLATAPFEVLDLGSDYLDGDFADTAAVLANLDLLVTCDTAAVHLAGALGLPTWLAISTVPDWRWLEARADSPWYPSVRIFRQQVRGEWGGVFAAMAEALLSSTTENADG